MNAVEQRFWSKVERKGKGECWNWKGFVGDRGYGKYALPDRRVPGAHRVAYELTFGPIPKGLHVCHRCDNKICVNPDHLFLGTNLDNSNDKVAKGRHARGARIASAKLTDAIVREIRRRHATGESARVIGRSFGVGKEAVNRVLRGTRWKHVS